MADDPLKEPFKPLAPGELDRLIKKGTQDAKELDRAIGSQFELGAEERTLVLRSPSPASRQEKE